MNSLSYKDSGVDLELYEQAMDRLPALMKRTHSARVMPLMGGFAGLFRLNSDTHRYDDPVLVSGTDGVGTKLKVAAQAKVYDTVGIDLVAMCVNDCLCLGAEPLFFLDYLALGKDDPDVVSGLVKGVATGCEQARSALIGGETAIMPDLYAPGDFDMAGFCVGVVEKTRILDGSDVVVGDRLIGLASTGFHSNGYSLVRKAVFEKARLDLSTYVPELQTTVSDALLTPTRIYADIVAAALAEEAASLHAIAHITGGGLADNLGRVMPGGCQAQIDRDTWQPLPVFPWLASLGNVQREEMYQVFNMGIGMVFVVAENAVDRVQELAKTCGIDSYLLGEVKEVNPGETGAVYVS